MRLIFKIENKLSYFLLYHNFLLTPFNLIIFQSVFNKFIIKVFNKIKKYFIRINY